MASILVLGASGYVGTRLVARLAAKGYRVRCLVRDSNKFKPVPAGNVEVIQGDVLKAESLRRAFDGIELVYYLVHSMSAGEQDFEERDNAAARTVRLQCEQAHVRRIVYLGGLGTESEQSPHLRSRHEVGRILRSGPIPVTEFRAAVVVGSGSLSFEMVHHLVNRLPVMICPRWLTVRTQPIFIGDVLEYLVEAVNNPRSVGKIFDIGGADVLTYRDMMLVVARVLGLRRLLIQIPILTPRLSSYWVNLVTPVSASLARTLIESVRNETVCRNTEALEVFGIQPISYEESVRRALASVISGETNLVSPESSDIDEEHFLTDERTCEVHAPAGSLFHVVSSIGGMNGWYYADWLWKVRGWIDSLFGGVGLRRGRRDPVNLELGDVVDFWRVESCTRNQRILLRAEMKVWGKAWLEFRIESPTEGVSTLIQTARYYPKGVFGLAYWYGIYPLHAFVFRGMALAIKRRAEELKT
jgi:uncharacterized protein YbjT (DUF2867 family)